MGKSTSMANSFLNLVCRAIDWANIADDAAVAPLTDLYIGLHTGALAAGDAQNVNEADFGDYDRLPIARSGVGFNAASGGSVENAALAQFAECSSGTNVITHVSIGVAASGATVVLWSGALSAPRTISSGIQAQFAAEALVITET